MTMIQQGDCMYTRLLSFLCLFFFTFSIEAAILDAGKVRYPLKKAPIDVVIVSHPKDKETIDLCIHGIKSNCSQIRRVIVVSPERLTNKAEWFDEKKYPFSINDVELQIGRGSLKRAQSFFESGGKRSRGWYFQQLLKLYAPFVIPDISQNVLLIDADTIFLNPVEFTNDSNGGLFCTNPRNAFTRYIHHAERLVPGYERIYPEFYSVCHHMLLQKPILKHLFEVVEAHHQKPLWKAFCLCVDLNEGGASEYEIYYNFALRHTDQVEIRPLLWKNSPFLGKMKEFKKQGYHYVSFHTYLRDFIPAPKNKL